MANFCIPVCQDYNACTTEFPVGLDGTTVLLLTHSNWREAGKTFAIDGALATLTLPVNSEFYSWQAPKTSVTASSDNTKKVFAGTKYMHKVNLTGIGHSQADFNRFEAILNGETVAFVRTNSGIVKIFGADTGLVNMGSTFDFVANDGTFPIMLGTEEAEFENKLPLTSNVTWENLLSYIKCE